MIIDFKVSDKVYDYLLAFFPGYDYHKCLQPERLDYRRPDNLTGHQQRCFCVYWCLKCADKGGIGVDMGCGEIIHPFCFGVDKYCGDSHPDYPSPVKANYHPHLVARADKPLPFTDNCFDWLVSHHSLEHMIDTAWTLREWVRIVKHGGLLALVLPDAKYGIASDKDHQVDYAAETFKTEVLDPFVEEGLVTIEEFDNLQNFFSFNVVLRKK